MKKLLLYASVVTVFFVSFLCLNARIITVDNNKPKAGDYETLKEAHTAANNGDTLLFFPSDRPYDADTITKTLHLFGTGFAPPDSGFLMTYCTKGKMKTTMMTGQLIFNNGSEGSSIQGIREYNSLYMLIKSNNISIKKNYYHK